MTRYSPRLAASTACSQPVSLPRDCCFDGAASAAPRSAGALLRRFLHGLAMQRPRLTRLSLDELSPDRLRDLGLLDGRGVPPRHPWRS